MSVFTYHSTCFESGEEIARDLLAHLPDAASARVGILFCDSQIDFETVLETIQERVSFPVVGGTALAFPFSGENNGDVSASLTIVEKEGLSSAIVVSETLDQERHAEQMRLVYESCRDRLGEEPKLVLPFFPLMPQMVLGQFIDDIFLLAGETPVYGGITTNDLVSTRAAVFAEGKAMSDRMILIMLGGSIRPVFATSNLVTPMTEYAATVAVSKGNEVFQVDNSSFCDYMRTIGISPEDRINGVDALMQYGPTPVLLDTPDRVEDDVPEVRCISFTDLVKESAMFSGPVPVGTRMRMSVLRREDVNVSTMECLEKLRARMRKQEADGYSYSAVLCISCVARYFVLVGGTNSEREALMDGIHPQYALTGLYAFCEIGPSFRKDQGTYKNRSHSASIAMCAL